MSLEKGVFFSRGGIRTSVCAAQAVPGLSGIQWKPLCHSPPHLGRGGKMLQKVPESG